MFKVRVTNHLLVCNFSTGSSLLSIGGSTNMNILLSTYNAQNIFFFCCCGGVGVFLETNEMPVKGIFRGRFAQTGKIQMSKVQTVWMYRKTEYTVQLKCTHFGYMRLPNKCHGENTSCFGNSKGKKKVHTL